MTIFRNSLEAKVPAWGDAEEKIYCNELPVTIWKNYGISYLVILNLIHYFTSLTSISLRLKTQHLSDRCHSVKVFNQLKQDWTTVLPRYNYEIGSLTEEQPLSLWCLMVGFSEATINHDIKSRRLVRGPLVKGASRRSGGLKQGCRTFRTICSF